MRVTLKDVQREHEKLKAVLIILSILCSILLLALMMTAFRNSSDNQITVPKYSGLYLPTNKNDKVAVAVFDLNNSIHAKLVSELQTIFKQLESNNPAMSRTSQGGN